MLRDASVVAGGGAQFVDVPSRPPAMRTSMMSADTEVRRKMIYTVPMGRQGRVEEVAHANLFLASDDASYVTGIEVPVDGGFVAQ